MTSTLFVTAALIARTNACVFANFARASMSDVRKVLARCRGNANRLSVVSLWSQTLCDGSGAPTYILWASDSKPSSTFFFLGHPAFAAASSSSEVFFFFKISVPRHRAFSSLWTTSASRTQVQQFDSRHIADFFKVSRLTSRESFTQVLIVVLRLVTFDQAPSRHFAGI